MRNFDFNGQHVRTLMVDGEPWFVASDVSSVLGYRKASDMSRVIDRDDKGAQMVSTPGGAQEATVISEPGLYTVIMQRQAGYVASSSMQEQIKSFQRWVTHEVLPTLRKTGSYGTAPALTGKELLAAALLEAQATMAEKDFQLHAQAQQLEAAAPKVTYVDQFVAEHDLLSFRTVAASLDVGEQELRQYLTAKKWMYCQSDERWSNTHGRKVKRNRYSAYAEKKAYFQPVLNHEAPRFRGGEVMHTLKITPAGASAITRLYTASTKELTA
ncbi:BRO family protein [Arthrobacter sp. 9V]|uniref:BRO family protein n=1 Tax=Arthrobacter sp. 9V TaxID=2653132 RepID=UPI001F36F069|nr:BRO family protein [Arthrobacter sp. 9V]